MDSFMDSIRRYSDVRLDGLYGKLCMESSRMPTEQCSDAGDATMDINHPGGQGTVTYYFAVVAYDDKSNMNNAEPQTDILLEHSNEVVDPCEVDLTVKSVLQSAADVVLTVEKFQHGLGA